MTESVGRFFEKYAQTSFDNGTTILEPNDTPQNVYYVQSGSVEQYDIAPNGSRIILNIYKAGAFFSMAWALNDVQNLYFFSTKGQTILRLAPSTEVKKFLLQNPEVCVDVLARLSRGADGLLSRLNIRMTGTAEERVRFELQLHAMRFGQTTDSAFITKLKMQELADLTGLSRETVSRTIARMHSEGLLAHNKNTFTIAKTKM